ncbi:RNA polymerase factor sigma-54 [Thalassorhabdus alkalitolerans]|uniref:RNA polymerase factor sigma-54 n=1 Tax=Thalassorhabdus alkalitolerans TaxID=2282697 RepID=A0ABW0YGM8_9BACI
MNLEMGLFQQQTMKLMMTQELRQAISLLQYSTMELSEYLEEQALDNPLIDLMEAKEKEQPNLEMPVLWQDDHEEYHEKEEREYTSPFDRIPESANKLSDYVQEEIRLMPLSGQKEKLLNYLARNIGEDGYLKATFEEAAESFSVTEEEYEEGVMLLQSLEPAGIGARSLKECLLIQLQRLEPRHKLAETLVEHHLEKLAERKWKDISKETLVSLEEIQEVYDFIQKLEPRPGANFGGEHPGHIVPDVFIEKRSGGEYMVILNDDGLPRIRLNKHYRHLLEGKSNDEASDYAMRKYKQLMWLLKSIDQRQQSLRSISEAILSYQQDFFEKGPSYLKPMTLRDVAEMAEVHESTVSRTTTNKYMQTPHGLFELKYFFTSKIENGSGAETSAFVIKSFIREMVEREDKKKPLSDQKMVDALKSEKGITISRRAVAKYRDELNILSSSKRKRYA